jgi:TPR repeat protein
MEFQRLLQNLAFRFPKAQLLAGNNGQMAIGDSLYNYAVKCEQAGKEKDAFNFYSRAEEKGSVEAMYALGVCFYNGIGCEKSEATGIKYFIKAAEKENSNALCALGICFLAEEKLEKAEKERAIDYFNELKNNGHADATFALGACYMLGIIVEKDERKGMAYLKEAEEKCSTNAIEYFKEVQKKREANERDTIDSSNERKRGPQKCLEGELAGKKGVTPHPYIWKESKYQ